MAITNSRSRPWTWPCSQGAGANWVRWVTSCRQTQSRKSPGSTSSSRSVATMFGATSVSRPAGASPPGRPRPTRRAEQLELPQHPGGEIAEQAADLEPGCARTDRCGDAPAVWLDCARAPHRDRVGDRTLKLSTLARIQSGRSTTTVSALPDAVSSPVISATWRSARSASRRRSSTVATASREAESWARRHQPGAGGRREPPVDQLATDYAEDAPPLAAAAAARRAASRRARARSSPATARSEPGRRTPAAGRCGRRPGRPAC